jgi:hypothetical protein
MLKNTHISGGLRVKAKDRLQMLKSVNILTNSLAALEIRNQKAGLMLPRKPVQGT